MKRIILLIISCLYMINIDAQTVYSDTVFSEGKIVITKYIVNEQQEKVSIAEPLSVALDLFLLTHPLFDYRFPHYGWYRPVVIKRPYYYAPQVYRRILPVVRREPVIIRRNVRPVHRSHGVIRQGRR